MTIRPLFVAGFALLTAWQLSAQAPARSPKKVRSDVVMSDFAGPGDEKTTSNLSNLSPEHLLLGLVLTDEQLAKVKTIVEDSKGKLDGLVTNATNAEKAYAQAASDPNTSADQLKKLFIASQSAEFDLKQEESNIFKSIEALLSPEQKQQMKTFETKAKAFASLMAF